MIDTHSAVELEKQAPVITSTHLRLLVENFDQEFKFFRDVLGFKATFGNVGENYADFDCNGFTIALFKRRLQAEDLAETNVHDKQGADHVALIFGVSDVDEMTARLKKQGVPFVTEPHDRHDWGIRVSHFRDPEGNLIEINHGLPSN